MVKNERPNPWHLHKRKKRELQVSNLNLKIDSINSLIRRYWEFMRKIRQVCPVYLKLSTYWV